MQQNYADKCDMSICHILWPGFARAGAPAARAVDTASRGAARSALLINWIVIFFGHLNKRTDTNDRICRSHDPMPFPQRHRPIPRRSFLMYEITMAQPSRDYLAMWQAAGNHIQSFFQDGLESWFKVDPRPPFLEHLSFRLGNQVFFIRLEDVEGRAEVPGNREGLLCPIGANRR
jgi:hypothetical protein